VANHLIFVAPYLTKGSSAQQKYDAAMTQAIGRARRFGQTKRVHVYHYLANKTIDVDIIEKRSSMVLKTVEDIGEDEPPFAGFEESRVGLALPGGEDSRGEFSSSAASEIFSPGSDYA
jgi:SNF2 family DNA or RNA helicase